MNCQLTDLCEPSKLLYPLSREKCSSHRSCPYITKLQFCSFQFYQKRKDFAIVFHCLLVKYRIQRSSGSILERKNIPSILTCCSIPLCDDKSLNYISAFVLSVRCHSGMKQCIITCVSVYMICPSAEHWSNLVK